MTSFFILGDLMQDRALYINSIKTSFIKLAKDHAMKYLISQAVFFSWPVIGPLTALFIEKILTVVVNETETGIFFAYVDLRTARQSLIFSDMAMKNYQVQQTGTAKEKEDAEKDLIAAFDNFVKLNHV